MRRDEIKQLIESQGVRSLYNAIESLLEGTVLENGAKIKMKPEQFSIREIWEGSVGPVEETLTCAGASETMFLEAVDSTAFIAITKLLLHSKVIEAYEAEGGIGDKLVTVMPSSRRVENIAGFTESEGVKEVPESMPYEDSTLTDKYVTTTAMKKGRIVGISEEAVMEDQTGQLLLRAQRIGERCKVDKERTIINAVLDKDGSVWRPSGTPTALYSTANGNLAGTAGAVSGYTSALPLVDWNTLEKIETFHSLSITDDRVAGEKEPIMWNPTQLLCAKGIAPTALRIRNATEVRMTTTNAVTGDARTTFTNPKANSFEVLSSPFIASSGVSGAAVDWLYGDFKRQFLWREIWPLQVFAQRADGPQAFERDIVARFKVRYLGGINAIDNRYVVKVKAA